MLYESRAVQPHSRRHCASQQLLLRHGTTRGILILAGSGARSPAPDDLIAASPRAEASRHR